MRENRDEYADSFPPPDFPSHFNVIKALHPSYRATCNPREEQGEEKDEKDVTLPFHKTTN